MKSRKTDIILISIIGISSIVLLAMLCLSIGSTDVASYENYVIGGFGGFLILENLFIPFIIFLIAIIISSAILLYRVIRKMQQKKLQKKRKTNRKKFP